MHTYCIYICNIYIYNIYIYIYIIYNIYIYIYIIYTYILTLTTLWPLPTITRIVASWGFVQAGKKLLADKHESCRVEPNYKIKSGYQPMYSSEAQVCAIMATLPLLWPQRCRSGSSYIYGIGFCTGWEKIVGR